MARLVKSSSQQVKEDDMSPETAAKPQKIDFYFDPS